MSELITAARPYARAVLELAREQNRYADWSKMLEFMAAVAHDPTMRAVLESPVLNSAQSAELFISVCTDNIDERGQNFIKLLIINTIPPNHLIRPISFTHFYDSFISLAKSFNASHTASTIDS